MAKARLPLLAILALAASAAAGPLPAPSWDLGGPGAMVPCVPCVLGVAGFGPRSGTADPVPPNRMAGREATATAGLERFLDAVAPRGLGSAAVDLAPDRADN